jgi:DNA-binding NtrC family response regulator|uniref:Sigma-54-dependent Fis family transcriptional regulator n=1 Tax=candidate division WOR-3 bacterium TaxID=2052148 RepID=A0A7V3NTR7_UNCW3
MRRVLVVDDDKGILVSLEKYLVASGYEVFSFENPLNALKELEKIVPDLAILDLRMPEMSGMDLLSEIKKANPEIYVILITAYGTLDSAIEAIRRRADDFLLKPFKLQDLEAALTRAERFLSLKEENVRLKEEIQFLKEYEIVGKSKPLLEVLDKIKQIAPYDTTCLIYGETGTGKELAARAIHYNSPRKDKPFIAINMAAMPEELVESELFGYKKGAFTGAFSDKDGLFKVAEGGTLFLDEISEASPKLQAKLLRVLDFKVITPLGATKEEKVDVRIIAATNRDLLKLVKEGKFREDLYYRLNVMTIHLPPLRERREDIGLLFNYFLNRFTKKYGKKIKVDEEVVTLLESYDWPGNVRELEHLVEQLVITAEEGRVIRVEDAKKLLIKPAEVGRVKSLKEVEREYILNVLRSTGYNKREAANILGIDLSTLYRKLKEIGYEGK